MLGWLSPNGGGLLFDSGLDARQAIVDHLLGTPIEKTVEDAIPSDRQVKSGQAILSPLRKRRIAISTEENKALVRRWFSDVISQGDMSSFDAICAACHADFEMIRGVATPAPRGVEGAKGLISSLRAAFPDLTAAVNEQIAEGDKVVTVVSMTGTHEGDFMGIPPTGRTFDIQGVSIWEVRGGQLISEWVSWDAMAMMEQLGQTSAPIGQA